MYTSAPDLDAVLPQKVTDVKMGVVVVREEEPWTMFQYTPPPLISDLQLMNCEFDIERPASPEM